MKKLLIIAFVAVLLFPCSYADDLILSRSGRTDYQLVPAENGTSKDVWNAEFLAAFLEKRTGAKFSITPCATVKSDKPAIFIGFSQKMAERLSALPFAGMKDQDHVVRSIGKDIFLYGKGADADFYAIVEFMEKCLGYKRYQTGIVPEIPKNKDLTLKPFDFRFSWAFHTRDITNVYFADYMRGATNVSGGSCWRFRPNRFHFSLKNNTGIHPAIPTVWIPATHTEFKYIPRNGILTDKNFAWVKNRDYFKTNPEFFSLGKDGKRHPSHLCFSNRELRKEFTANMEKHLEYLGREDVVLGVSYDDVATHPCECASCLGLEKKYGTPSGPILDYLLELCELFRKRHPATKFHYIAYRKNQTLLPPVMKKGEKLPDNLLIRVCPIGIAWNKPYRSQKDREILKRWTEISDHVSFWIYYPGYVNFAFLPFVSTSVEADNLRFFHECGIRDVFFEYPWYGSGWTQGTRDQDQHPINFSDLTKHIFFRLCKDPKQDVSALVTDFMKEVYGPAAEQAQVYHRELDEACCGKNLCDIGVSGRSFDKEFAYLTLPRLRRWSGIFDNMMKLTRPDTVYRTNVEDLRRSLDLAVYGRWNELHAAYPDYFRDPSIIRKRIGEPTSIFAARAKEYLAEAEERIQFAGQIKPLPEQFKGIEKSRIIRKIPPGRIIARTGGWGRQEKIKDNDAAFGYAVSVVKPEKPFRLGFYSKDSKITRTIVINPENMVPGKYQLYFAGRIRPTPNSGIWFSMRSWEPYMPLNTVYDVDATNAEYECWVSLKFPKDYKGLETDQVLCDQVIFVRQ